MKNILLSVIIMNTLIFTEIMANPSKPTRPSKPISRPISKPLIKDAIQNHTSRNNDTYYYNNNEDNHTKEISEKNEKIKALEHELNATRRAEHQALQKKNKTEYDKAMKAADSRKSSIQTENTITISDKPK